MYSRMETGEFITKSTDRKARLDERHKRMEAAAKLKPGSDNDDADDYDEETEKDRLECETTQLESDLRKAERQKHWHETRKNKRRLRDTASGFKVDSI